MNTTIFKGKELLMGRTLVRDSLSKDGLFSTDDLSIELAGNTIEVTANNINITGCYLSEQEMKRRGEREINYYISDDGALITTKKVKEEHIQLLLQVGQSILIDTILPRVRAASGAKYQDGDLMFWAKQYTAMLVYQGQLYGHCVLMFEDEMSFDPCTDSTLHEGVVAFLNHELTDDLGALSENDRTYYAERVDINNDDQEEIFVALTGRYFCGTGGCTWYILNPDYTLLDKFSVSDFPIYLSDFLSNGYRDLLVSSNGNYHELKYNDGYPSNPSVEPVFDLFSHAEYTTGGTRRVLEWVYFKGCRF